MSYFDHPAHSQLDLRQARRVFTFGDVHGELKHLEAEMARVGFDADHGDFMIGLGDWLDRGPDADVIADFIEARRHCLAFVVGNHELLLKDFSVPRDGGYHPYNLIRNGGQWINPYVIDEEGPHDLPVLNDEGRRIRDAVCKAPIAITAITPAGRKIGFVHAGVPEVDGELDWNRFVELLEQEGGFPGQAAKLALWERDQIEVAKLHVSMGQTRSDRLTVRNADHVFHGHNIVEEPIVYNNISWIDTGAYRTGNLTFVEVDTWVAEHS